MEEKLPYANNYQELLVYKKALSLTDDIYETSKVFPKEEVYSLTDQMRRSSRSIGAQIAEAWGKRLYIKHFVSKLTDAEAELNETQHWIDIAYRCHYLSISSKNSLLQQCQAIRNLLGGMIKKAELFCKRT